MTPVALITGITGQDGSYLAELLLGKGYSVHGIVRRSSAFNRFRIEHLRADSSIYDKQLFLHYADLMDTTTLRRIMTRVRPHEMYHLAGQSHVGLSFEIPESTCEETAMATLSLLEICRDFAEPPKFYHASSSEVFGCPDQPVQNEDTAFRPITPYGCAKVFATNLCRVYRQSHGLFACSGITYNHESVRRGENFVTRKIVEAALQISRGSQEVLELGNLEATRDWGYAPEFVEAMHQMLQQPKAEDYVIGTGTVTTVRDFVRSAFECLGITVEFSGQHAEEVGRDATSGRVLVKVNPRFFRPADPVSLVADPSRIQRMVGWNAQTKGVGVAKAMTEQARRLAP